MPRILTPSELASIQLNSLAIEQVPEAVARSMCVLPAGFYGQELYLIVPIEFGLGNVAEFERLRFVLGVPFRWDFAEVEALRQVVNFFYSAVYAEIDNCEPRFRYQCPRQFALLIATDDPSRRYCDQCQKDVTFCRTNAEVNERAARGECIAIFDPELDSMFLGLPDTVE
jgi:hypothetical protein